MGGDLEIGALDPSPSKGRRKLPLGFQVIFAVIALLALLVGVAVSAMVLLVGVDRAARAGEHTTPYGNAVAAAALDAKGVANDERGFLLTGDREFVTEASGRIRAAESAFAGAADAAETPAERSVITHARALFGKWVGGVRAEFARFQAGSRKAAVAASIGPNRAVRKTYESVLARAQTLARSAEQSSASSLSSRSKNSMVVLLVVIGAALAGAVSIGYWLVRSVAVPIYRILSILRFDSPFGLPSA